MLKNIVLRIMLVQLIYNTIFGINKKEFRCIESTELIKKIDGVLDRVISITNKKQ